MRLRVTAFFLSAVCFAALSQAATIADFTLSEFDGSNGGLLGPLTDTSVLDPGISVTAGSVEETGSSGPHEEGGGGSPAGQINWFGWAGGRTNYLSIEVTPASGATVDLDDVTYSIARNGLGAPSNLHVWVQDGVYSGDVLEPVDAVGSFSLGNSSPDVQFGGISVDNPKSVILTSVPDKTGVFSIVLGSDDALEGNLRLNDIKIAGTVSLTAVPEPGSACACMLGLVGFVARRRRK